MCPDDDTGAGTETRDGGDGTCGATSAAIETSTTATEPEPTSGELEETGVDSGGMGSAGVVPTGVVPTGVVPTGVVPTGVRVRLRKLLLRHRVGPFVRHRGGRLRRAVLMAPGLGRWCTLAA